MIWSGGLPPEVKIVAAALVELLRTSGAARRVFALQALDCIVLEMVRSPAECSLLTSRAQFADHLRALAKRVEADVRLIG